VGLTRFGATVDVEDWQVEQLVDEEPSEDGW
jgi:hypothetical protein